MVSENAHTGKKRRWPLALLTLALLAVACLAWLLGSESGARTVLSTLASYSNGALQVEGVRGTLAGPLQVKRVTLQQDRGSQTLSDIRLAWHPLALLRGTLHVSALHVGDLEITGKIDQTEEEPPALPDKIGLPLAVKVDALRIDSGRFKRGPVTLANFGPLALQAAFDGQDYRLRLESFSIGSTLEQGRVASSLSGEATLSARKPYPLQAGFASTSDAQLQQQTLGAAGRLTLDGSLEELAAVADLTVNGATVNGRATLRPFSPQVLGASHLQVLALDPARFGKDLPQALFELELHADEGGSGSVRLKNAQPGTWDAHKLPLSAFSGTFRQQQGGFVFDRIAAQLDKAGNISGTGRYLNGALHLALRTESLNLQRLDARARPTRLSGSFDISHAQGRQQFTLALSEPLQRQRITLDVQGVVADDEVRLSRADLQAGNARLAATGRFGLAGTQSFEAEARLTRFRLQEFGKFPNVPEFELNGELTLRGARQPQLAADLAFRIANSMLAGEALHGEGNAQLRGEHLKVPAFTLVAGQNSLNVQGQLDNDKAELGFTLDAQRLTQFGKGFDGVIQANGTVRGTLKRPRIVAHFNANDVRLPEEVYIGGVLGSVEIVLDQGKPFMLDTLAADLGARTLRQGGNLADAAALHARFGQQPEAPLELDLHIEGIDAGLLAAERFTIEGMGTTAQHTITLNLSEHDQIWTSRASGGLTRTKEDVRWQGSIAAFDARGRINARLAAPAPLLVAPPRVRLDRFTIETDVGRIALEQFVKDNNGTVTRGRIERLQVVNLLGYVQLASLIDTDLLLDGEWNLNMGQTVSGSALLRRERGDVTMLGSTPVSLGLRTLTAGISADNGKLALQLRVDGERLGRIAVDMRTVAGGGEGALSITPDAPLSGSAHVDIPALSWLGPLLSPSGIAGGQLQSRLTLGGTFAHPALSGSISGSDMRIALPDIGIDMRNGMIDSEFRNDRLLLKQLTFEGGEGRVTLSGPIDLGAGNLAVELALKAERFALLNRADRRLVMSGDSRIALREGRTTVNGDFRIDSGSIDLGHEDKPRLGDDVVIVGQKKKTAGKTGAHVDITIALANNVRLRGYGLTARLGGKLRITGDPGEIPQAEGSLHVTRGTFSAYGRDLDIEHGVLRFTGSLSNPSMDVLAMKRGQEVEAGVSVRGTVLAPRITLVSDPVVPDAEKLSWLVLGRGLEMGSDSDAATLQSAAAALLAEGAKAGVQASIASAFGLDTLSVSSTEGEGDVQERIVTVGKQISARLYLAYQQSIDAAGSVVQLRYLLTRRLTIEAEAGTRSALTLFYNIAFD